MAVVTHMARARGIKPGFFTNDALVELPFSTRLLFIGLWTIADKEGRLLDRPKKIRMEIFPADDVDCEQGLTQLADKGFLLRYEVAGVRYIQVMNWRKHQNPHIKETDSQLPAPEIPGLAPEIPVQAGLIPDSGFLTPDPLKRAGALVFHESLPTDAWDEWITFRKSKRYPTDDITLRKHLKLLARHPADVQRQIIDASINSNWQGLFEPKTKQPQQPAKRERPPTPAEVAEARRRAAEDNHAAMQKLGLAGTLKGMP